MLRIYTGRNRLLAPALTEALRQAGPGTQLIVVPRQLTLQTERMLLSGLGLAGSFDLQVLSAERLCGRIFEAAGQPEGTRVDDRGRVMLVRAAVRDAQPRLTLYRSAVSRRGFAERAAKQLERIRQAGLSPETLRACAAGQAGTSRLKLNDLSHILESYEALIAGRYQDGEAEFTAAAESAADAAFLAGCRVWFFGFDMVPPTLHELMASVAAAAKDAAVFLSLENDDGAPDAEVFLPMRKGLARLTAAARRRGAEVLRVPVTPETVPEPPRRPELAHLERELFAWPSAQAAASGRVQLAQLRNPREECMFAAARIRRLVRENGWRWQDVLILLNDPQGYLTPMRTAFATYGIPLFQAESRPAGRHPMAECLLGALRAVEKGFPAEEVRALLRTGLLPVTEDEADRFANYIEHRGLWGARLLKPLSRGDAAEIEALEPVRERACAPLGRLRDRLRRAGDLRDQLKALFDLLTEIGAYEKGLERMEHLSAAGYRQEAGEEAQVWNRILGAMDQMEALLGGGKLPLRELREVLDDALSASLIKALPQSGDAVFAQGAAAAVTRGVKALFVLGAVDRAAQSDDGLLSPAQRTALSAFARAYLGPDDTDLSLLKRFYLKSALGMASEFVCISCPLSGSDDGAVRPGTVFDLVRGLFPGTPVEGGVTSTPAVEAMLRSTPAAAAGYAARALAAVGEGASLSEADGAALAAMARLAPENAEAEEALRRLDAALDRAGSADALRPGMAEELYGRLHGQSITSLEAFAACPFSYYVKYGLRPERIEPFELTAADEGGFLHEAVRQFVIRSREDLQSLSAASASERMRDIAGRLLEEMAGSGPLGDNAVALAERRRLMDTACECAVRMAEHMEGSAFRVDGVEYAFGPGDGPLALTLPDGCTLYGRIDRTDLWETADTGYMRVIDYKRGGKALDLAGAWYGTDLQLPVYLAAVRRLRGVRSAGVYYFPLKEGIVDTQERDGAQVEALRTKELRMEGLLPADGDILRALSPKLEEVMKVSINKDGSFKKGTAQATEEDFVRLGRHALKMAARFSAEIRRGRCEAAPVQIGSRSSCTYCDWRDACLFDASLDAGSVVRRQSIDAGSVLELLREEEEKEAGGSE